jgi:hypothetical protein
MGAATGTFKRILRMRLFSWGLLLPYLFYMLARTSVYGDVKVKVAACCEIISAVVA